MALTTYDEFKVATREKRQDLIRDLVIRIAKHRYQDHHCEDDNQFFDCALCGAMDRRLDNFMKMIDS